MDNQNIYTVYIHTNKINNKKYVGLTKQNVLKRWENGQGYRFCTLFDKAIKKYGWDNFSHEIVATGLTESQACDLEKQMIKELKTCNPEYGYNIFEGGNSSHQTEDAKRRISEKQKGIPKPDEVVLKMQAAQMDPKNREKIRNALLGHKRPEWVCNKLRGKKKQHKCPVVCIETGIVYDSRAMAARETGACPSAIKKCCDGIGRSSGGYTWKYL